MGKKGWKITKTKEYQVDDWVHIKCACGVEYSVVFDLSTRVLKFEKPKDIKSEIIEITKNLAPRAEQAEKLAKTIAHEKGYKYSDIHYIDPAIEGYRRLDFDKSHYFRLTFSGKPSDNHTKQKVSM